jgi:patatin-like phospholipase/acyl hydrolase
VEETDAEDQDEIHGNIATTNPMFATWQILKKRE